MISSAKLMIKMHLLGNVKNILENGENFEQ